MTVRAVCDGWYLAEDRRRWRARCAGWAWGNDTVDERAKHPRRPPTPSISRQRSGRWPFARRRPASTRNVFAQNFFFWKLIWIELFRLIYILRRFYSTFVRTSRRRRRAVRLRLLRSDAIHRQDYWPERRRHDMIVMSRDKCLQICRPPRRNRRLSIRTTAKHQVRRA